MSDETALAPYAPEPVGLDFANQDATIAWADKVAGSGIFPQHIKKAGDVLAVYQLSRELGLSVMACARGVHSVKGKLVMSADLMAAIVMGHGVLVDYPEYSAEKVTCSLTRPGRKAQAVTWTTEDAKRAGLGGDNWRKYPRAMLKARALSEVARLVCPDMLAGCYVPGEIEIVDTTATVVEPERRPPIEYEDDHPPQRWDDERARKGFYARLGELGNDYDTVAEWCESNDRPRPPDMSTAQRARLLLYLGKIDGQTALSRWVDVRDAGTRSEPAAVTRQREPGEEG